MTATVSANFMRTAIGVHVDIGDRMKHSERATASVRCNLKYIHRLQAGTLEMLFDQHPKTAAGRALTANILKIARDDHFAVIAGNDCV